jgi:very-short-patch-repair endonuclease
MRPDKPANHSIERRRKLRAILTPAEAKLWLLLQRSQLGGRKFRRQHSIGLYIVDFYCAPERLIVELDGAAHDSERAAARDEVRHRFLDSAGYSVLRFENRQVFENPEGVLEQIRQRFRRH